ncbi:NAD(P)/FAD-dependent oxidoreductase [Streptomyces sp. NPDC094032]|uniref:NAD(P)/FAD-dependent oxidoreductase n=1 Tax=Streptomyces sp. NPDC094032 TaxID=3155308 RepID=UPI00331E306F
MPSLTPSPTPGPTPGPTEAPVYDVVIVGGGPAGLAAATTLGRTHRSTLLLDAGSGRNRASRHSHGFLTRDGLPPAELRALGLGQLSAYRHVEHRALAVAGVKPEDDHFAVSLADGSTARGRRLLLATGMTDVLPELPGLAEAWGVSAFNCPYCDAHEVADERVVVLGGDGGALRLALQLSRFVGDITVCSGGEEITDEGTLRLLLRRGVKLRTEPYEGLDVDGEGRLRAVAFADGGRLDCRAAFLRPPTRQGSTLPEELGCSLFEDGSVEVNDFQQTTVRGVFAAGDLARRASLPFPASQIVHAASAGSLAAVVMDQELLGEEAMRG